MRSAVFEAIIIELVDNGKASRNALSMAKVDAQYMDAPCRADDVGNKSGARKGRDLPRKLKKSHPWHEVDKIPVAGDAV